MVIPNILIPKIIGYNYSISLNHVLTFWSPQETICDAIGLSKWKTFLSKVHPKFSPDV